MKKKENAIKEKVIEMFCNISELSIKRMSPFVDIHLEIKDYDYTYSNYLKLYNEIEDSLRNEIFQAIIKKAKFNIKRELLRSAEEFADIFPVHSKSIAKFYKLIEDRKLDLVDEEDIERILKGKDENIKVVSNIKKVFKERLSDFTYCRKIKGPGELIFKKKLNEEANIMVVVDKGSWRSWLHFLVGVDNPEVLIDINKIFLLNKSVFDFNTEKELYDILLKAEGLIKKIAEIMVSVLGSHQVNPSGAL